MPFFQRFNIYYYFRIIYCINYSLLKKKRVLRALKKFTFILGLTFILLEITLGIYTHIKNLKIETPTYTFENTQSFWFDNNKDFGTSHFPNHTYRQKKTCYDVIYKSNSNGFRDKERVIKDSDNRVLVLGDSFIEGVGVSSDDRLSNLLEKEENVPHLNFGIAGNFGPTQYYLLYKTLASNFTHDALLIGILPSNDFIDDDYEINLKASSDRYKPYFVGAYPEYSLIYYQDSIHKSRVHVQKRKPVKKLLKNFTYSYNVLLYLKALIKQSIALKNAQLTTFQAPDYFNYTKEQLNKMKYALEQIKVIAGKRKVMVFTIPTFEEIKTYKKSKNNPLGLEMTAFCKSRGIEFLDLLEVTNGLSIEECEKQFLSCDGHWSEKGNIHAKEWIQSYFDYYR